MTAASPAPGIVTRAIGSCWIGIEGPTVLEVAEGELLVGDGDELVRVGAGDLVCVAPRAGCRLRGARGDARVDCLAADAAWVERALGLAGSARDPGDRPFLVDRRNTDRARQGARLIREIRGAERDPGEGDRLRLAARCLELLAMTLESRRTSLSTGIAARGNDRRTRFLRVVEALRAEPLDEVTLPAFARRAGLSERHVSRLFQLELGRSFREHLAQLRLERAKALLRGTEMTVLEVAGETGWSSLAHFNSVFRRRVGATPSQFRLRAAS